MSISGISPRSDDHANDLAPLVLVEVGAGRIVAAAVEQCDVAGARAFERRNHVVEADDPLPALIIRIFLHPEPHRGDDRRMVGPGRGADQHAGVRIHRRQQLKPEPQRAASARRLDAKDALVVGMMAEQDRTKQLGKALVARASEIGLGGLRIEQPLLGFLHHLEDRGVAGRVAKYADPDVDLVRPRIGVRHRNQDEQ